MNRIVRVVDGVRDLAMWLSPAFSTAGSGRGPLASSGEFVSAGSKPVVGSNPAYNKAQPGGVSITDVAILD